MDEDGFDADAHAREYDPEARARALQSLLVEKDLLSVDAVDDIVATYEEEIGPQNGARVVARAWTDPDYRERLLTDATAAIEELGIDVDTDSVDIEVVANDDSTHHLVVCTLCSCYPWPLLGLPPTWYKTPEYRSRAVRDPRGLLAEEFDLDLADDVRVEVHDSTSELRYMVLPQRPPAAGNREEDALADLVGRDAMIGVDRLGTGQVASDGGASAADGDRLHDLDLGDRPTFEAPWQARAFAVAVALTREDTWKQFQRRLVAAERPADDGEAAYYRRWLTGLERFVVSEFPVSGESLASRAAEFAAGDRTAHEFVAGDPHGHADHDHDHAH